MKKKELEKLEKLKEKIKRKVKKRVINSGNKSVDKLYNAVIDYVESNGGNVSVIGGIAIVQENPEARFNYGVMVRVTGVVPIPPKRNSTL